MAGEASSSEGGLRKIVSSLTRALNKNQGYLADAKKNLTFDGANITEFLIDYENLAALLKWTEEEKMDNLGQHVSLSLGRDIMAIVAASRSWKETRDVMMRKYLAAEKMATEADLAAVQRKNFATYNDFLQEFTLVALRIPGVTDRIMSEYFLRQFSEFDKDKILSAYQQTSKFVNTRDIDFSTVTDLAEKMVVTETLALLQEGEVIDLTGRTSDKAQVSRPALPPQEAVVPPGVANRGFGRRDPANEQCRYCTAMGHYVRACPKLNHDILKRRCTRSLKGEILGPQGERVNWNSPGGMRRAVIMLNGLEIAAVEAEPVVEIIWDQLRGRGPQVNFILENDGRDRVNATTRLGTAGRRIIRDTVMEEVAGSSVPQAEPEAGEPEKVYGKPREEEPTDKVAAAKKKFRYQIPILSIPEVDDTLSKLLGTMVSVSFHTMLQANPRLLKGLRQLLTRRRVEIDENPEAPKKEREEEAPQEVANLRRSSGDLEDLEKAFADIRLSLPDREGGEVMRAPPGTKLSFHALPVGKLKIQIGTHYTDALVDGGAEITLIRRDFTTITGCTVNKEVTGSIRGNPVRRSDLAKTDKISQWPTTLRTTTEVRAFFGVVDFWRNFIKNFAKIAEPIWAMIREEGTMDWTEEQEGAVQTFKDILTSEKVALSAPCFNDEVGRPFILETDGGPLAVGGVLIQQDEEGKERPLRFESRTLNSAERRYSQFKKEVLAILHCLKTFQAYLFGRRFTLRIDPTNVAGALKNYRPIDPTVGRWVEFIWRFDYKIERIAGIRNKVDGLSRVCITPDRVEDAKPVDAFLEYEGGTLAVDNEMMGEECASEELLIRTLEKGVPAIVAELREGPVTTRGRKEERDSWGAIVGPREELITMAVEGGREAVMNLVESWERKELRWMVNQMQERKNEDQEGKEFFYAQLDVIQAMHDGLAGGHRSSKGTLAKIAPLYYWPGMASMVAIYFQTCLICQERSSACVFEPLRPTRVLGSGHLVHLDLAVMPVSTDGYKYILDARENLSGFVEAVALKKKTGRRVADWIKDFYLRHPFVRRFVEDNGTEFVNQEVLGMLKRLCIPIKLIEPYHPKANALVERGHRTLKNTIAKLTADHLGSWLRYLKQTVFSENMIPKRTTGCIPAELWYVREIDFPVEALIHTWNMLDDDPRMTTKELIEARYQQVLKNEEVMEDIANRVLDSRMRDKARWDQVKNLRKEPLQVGEMVLLRNSALESTWSGQLGRRFKGPYRIAKRVGLNTFELEDLDGTGLKGPFPRQRLVRFLSRDPVEQWLQEAGDKETEGQQVKDWQRSCLHYGSISDCARGTVIFLLGLGQWVGLTEVERQHDLGFCDNGFV
ncbi:hypothetical protein CBR_g32528 [Chara braunii]|uniref:Integrase catalytic domain-containing protein n=1 Tax=Chara braunii TaxID=69332 RepID=A0A388LGU6_CHABU|nr:hypothetical protein CBR_g32528 [Chara braunii]|eukprot:GBG81539.1 hypothetical protein CBR_g32528 [Chara braunii]